MAKIKFDNKIKPVAATKPYRNTFDHYRGQQKPHFFIADVIREDDPDWESTFGGTGPINEVSGQPNVPNTSTEPEMIEKPTGNTKTDENGNILEEIEMTDPQGQKHLIWQAKDMPEMPMGYDFANVVDNFDYTPEGLAEAIKELQTILKTSPRARIWWREWVDNDFSNEDYIDQPDNYKIDPSFGRD